MLLSYLNFLDVKKILKTFTIDHLTVRSLVPKPLSEREAEVDLVLIKTSFLFFPFHAKKLACYSLIHYRAVFRMLSLFIGY